MPTLDFKLRKPKCEETVLRIKFTVELGKIYRMTLSVGKNMVMVISAKEVELCWLDMY